MKKILKIVLVYSIGIISVLVLSWRVSRIDNLSNNNSLVNNSNMDVVYYN